MITAGRNGRPVDPTRGRLDLGKEQLLALQQQHRQSVREWSANVIDHWSKKPLDLWPCYVIDLYLSTHRVLQRGPRQMRLWRAKQFMHGHPVLKAADAPPPLDFPTFLRIEPASAYSLRFDPCLFLRVPHQVLYSNVFEMLHDPYDLLSVMLTCRQFQCIAHAILMRRAQQYFGPRGTPMALICMAYYSSGNRESAALKRRRLDDAVSITSALNLAQRDWRLPLFDVIMRSIERNGYIDYIAKIKSDTRAAQLVEDVYVESQADARMAHINKYIIVERSVKNRYRIASKAVKRAIVCVLGYGQYKRFMSALVGYIDMRGSTSLEHIVDLSTMNIQNRQIGVIIDIAKQHMDLQYCLPQKRPAVHPVTSELFRVLCNLNDNRLFGAKMCKEEWFARVRYIFSKEFWTSLKGDYGNMTCLWVSGDATIEVHKLATGIPMSIDEHKNEIAFIAQNTGYRLRPANPITNLPYNSVFLGSPYEPREITHCHATRSAVNNNSGPFEYVLALQSITNNK